MLFLGPGFSALMMSVRRLAMRLGRMFMCLGRMLMAPIVLALAMMFGCRAMRLCRVLVMLGGFRVFFFRHFLVPFL